MDGPTVAQVSKLLKKFSFNYYQRLMAHPFKKRMEILKELAGLTTKKILVQIKERNKGYDRSKK